MPHKMGYGRTIRVAECQRSVHRDPSTGFVACPLAHCAEPLLKPSDDRVVVGEITSEERNGYKGNRLFYTAMIPVDELLTVLQTEGGLHHRVSSKASNTSLSTDGMADLQFWIQSPAGPRYESLIAVWDNSKHTVLQAHVELLDAYRLVPRYLANGTVCWDDLSRRVYDVVRVESVSTYMLDGYSTARVTVLRDYLEDFLKQRADAAVAVYFDERFSTDDPCVADIIGKHGWHIEQPGRQFWFKNIDLDFANQISQVSCTELLLDPKSSPISEPAEEDLFWPDRTAPVHGKGKGTFAHMELAYIRDEVPSEYEQQPGSSLASGMRLLQYSMSRASFTLAEWVHRQVGNVEIPDCQGFRKRCSP